MVIYTSRADSSFIQNEILAFSSLGETVTVIYERDSVIDQDLQQYAKFIQLGDASDSLKPGFVFKHFLTFIGVFLSTPFKDLIHASKHGELKTLVVVIQNALLKLNSLDAALIASLKKEGVLFSFWFYDLMFPLLLKRKGLIKQFYARAHRGDIYEGELGVNTLLFRRLYLKEIQALHPISDHGSRFIKQHYQEYADKISAVYLGSFRHYEPKLSGASKTERIIVSCAWINNKKRIHRIPEILAKLSFPFIWHHFGSGPDEFESQLRDAIAAHGIQKSVVLHGKSSNKSIQEFYANESPDCLISVSSTEGVPVSFMEALSYGIPVVATDVGGNNEIISDQSGALFPLDSDASISAALIEKTIERFESLSAKQMLIEQWHHKFDITANAQALVDKMKVHRLD